MSRKFDTIEELDAFADKLRKTKEIIEKTANVVEAPSEELIKFNEHGQWELNKGCDEMRAKIGEKEIAEEKKKADKKEAKKGEGINGPGTGAGSSL